MDITKKQILKTTFLPGIFPRVSALFGSGFGYLAYLIAVVYNTVRILPNTHSYLRPENIGTYSIRQAVAAAANNIKVNRKNIDQVIVFLSVIAAMIIMVIQFILLIIAMLVSRAYANALPTEIPDFFLTPNPSEDIAYRFLDLVFGIPEFFGSREATETPIHEALHSLLEFYSIGILIVGAMIILYLVVAIVAETARSGVPFGQRFNKSWAVVRLILFFGLLVPISNGMNAGQYITLFAAKGGSALASTGWVRFNQSIAAAEETLLGTRQQIVALPESSNLNHLPGFMMIARACKLAYDKSYNGQEYLPTWAPGDDTGVQAWAVINEETTADDGAISYAYVAERIEESTFQDLSARTAGMDINIVFGVLDEEEHREFNAAVEPTCGELILRVTDISEPGSAVIHAAYYDLVVELWDEVGINVYANNYVDKELNINDPNDPIRPGALMPNDEYIVGWENDLVERMEGDGGVIDQAVEAQIGDGDWALPQEMIDLGWAGAGIWYNRIAQKNGALVQALHHVPMQFLYPNVMERVQEARGQEDQLANIGERFCPELSAEAGLVLPDVTREDEIALMLCQVYRFWNNDDNATESSRTRTDNVILDVIMTILGTEGLFEICDNVDIHPLAQLSMLGKSLLDRSIQSFAASGVLALGSILPTQFAPTLSAASSFFGIFAGLGLLIGFILFYILPFLPFIYFFFAVGNWIKGIFEAIVAIPLWCLAHLRIDGEGIPGDAAIGGYFLIFEIFIRPILIVFGLLAAVTVFAAMVRVLNEIFYVVISNMAGHDPVADGLCFQGPNDELNAFQEAQLADAYRGPLDQFFYTVVYTIIVYIIGTTCFKLIDMIPNQILRWINSEVPAFNDGQGDSAEGLMKYAAIGGSRFGSSIGGSLSGIGQGLQQSVRQFMGGR